MRGSKVKSPKSLLVLILLHLLCVSFSAAEGGGYEYRDYIRQLHCKGARLHEPKTYEEVEEIVSQAYSTGTAVKAIGSLHSITGIICSVEGGEGEIVSLGKLNRVIGLDASRTRVRVQAGAKVSQLIEFIDENDVTMQVVPAFVGITIGGAIGTGAHGSSITHPSSISDYVEGMVVVSGTGQRVELTSAEEISAARVHLGYIGVILEVTLAVVPSPDFKLKRSHVKKPDVDIASDVARFLEEYHERHEMYWDPAKGTAAYISYDKVDRKTTADRNTWSITIPDLSIFPVMKAAGLVSEVVQSLGGNLCALGMLDANLRKNPVIAASHRVATTNCGLGLDLTSCPWEGPNKNQKSNVRDNSIFVPVEKLPKVFAFIKALVTKTSTCFFSDIWIRFLKKSDGFMSVAEGSSNMAAIEWINYERVDVRNWEAGRSTYQEVSQYLLSDEIKGRPHWGKNYPFVFKKAHLRYPKSRDFIAFVEKMDPKGLFRNEQFSILFDGANTTPSTTSRASCAVYGTCVCESYRDCGSWWTYKCIKGTVYSGARKCKSRIYGY
eukprot:Nk52_evm21s2118 gene=Nk52_evmTU21s2118